MVLLEFPVICNGLCDISGRPRFGSISEAALSRPAKHEPNF